ncbi:MAG: FHA domain-containing protein [Eubacteriales bacterium]|nr:FHA domain-containing protein [Eubacteriales bacterium]
MKVNKIQVKTKKGCQSINIKLLKGQQINFREVQIINQRAITQLMPVNYDDKNNMISFNTTGCYSLRERFKGVMNKQQFIEMLLEIIELMKNLQDKVMYQKNLLLDFDKIYYAPNQNDKQLLFLYVPIMNYDNHVNMKDYFMRMPYTIAFNNGENLNYVNEFIGYFNNNINFSVYDFEMFVHKMAGDVSFSGGTTNGQAQNNNYAMEQQHSGKICPNCHHTNANDSLFCESCGTRLEQSSSNEYNPVQEISRRLQENEYSRKAEQKPAHGKKVGLTGGTTFLGAVSGSDSTVILAPQEPEKKAVLIRKKSNERIIISKPQFMVGKEVAKVDYAVMNNNTVSRTHALFENVNKEYYIKDMSSTNGTFINNIKIEAGHQIKIKDGDLIRLSDEDFIFEYK